MNTTTSSLRIRRRGIAALAVLSVLLVAALLIVRAVLAPAETQWRFAGLPGETVHSLASAHSHPGVLFAATGTGVERRDTSGRWVRVLQASTVWSIALLPNDTTVYAGEEAGNVDVSHDAGAHWLRYQVSSQGVYAIGVQPEQSNVVLAGGAGGVFRSRDGGIHWVRTLALPHSAGAALAWMPGRSSIVYAGAVAGDTHGLTGVYESRDAGKHWRPFGSGLKSNAGIMSLAVDRRRHVFSGTMGNRIWQIPTGGSSWRLSAQGIPSDQHVASIAFVPGYPSQIYVATLGDGVFVSRDAGQRWDSLSGGLPSTNGDRLVLSLSYSALEGWAYAGTTDGVYQHVVR